MIFGRDLLAKQARDERLAHMVALVLAALTGKSTADFGKTKAMKPRCDHRRISRLINAVCHPANAGTHTPRRMSREGIC